MTENEWLGCTDPEAMVEFVRSGIIVLVDELPTAAEREAVRRLLQGTSVTRKVRLFACACCRHIWQILPDQRSRTAAEVAERFIDGLASDDQLQVARSAAQEARDAVNRQRREDGGHRHICRIAAHAA